MVEEEAGVAEASLTLEAGVAGGRIPGWLWLAVRALWISELGLCHGVRTDVGVDIDATTFVAAIAAGAATLTASSPPTVAMATKSGSKQCLHVFA